MKRIDSSASSLCTNTRGVLAKHQGGFVLKNIVHDFEMVADDGAVYEISDDIFHRVEKYLNSQYEDYKN